MATHPILHHSLQLGVAAVLLAGSFLVAPAQAQVLENVRVRLPNGQVLTLNDGYDWQRDPRVVVYKRYYYEPEERVYVVYNDEHDRYRYRDHHWQRGDHDDDHHGDNYRGRFCPPGQAKKGRC